MAKTIKAVVSAFIDPIYFTPYISAQVEELRTLQSPLLTPINPKKMNDEKAIDYITKLRGLGVWSAEMFLMFNLNRPDIFPIQDIGLLRAISINYKTSYPPSKRFLNKISKLHEDYRTVFTWYMWRSIDPTDVEY